MLRSSLSPAALIFLYSTIVALAVACRENKQTVATAYKQQQSQPLPSQTTQPNATTSPVTATADVAAASAFELGLDKAASAYSISQSAQSVEDWKLVASQYQEAIALLKQIERPSPYFAMAQSKIREYQRLLKQARQQALPAALIAPPAKPPKVIVSIPTPRTTPNLSQPPLATVQEKETYSLTPSDSPNNRQVLVVPTIDPKPTVFVAPIKRRIGGTPVIDVTFNGNKQFEMILDTGASGTVITQAMADALGIIPVAKAKANTASAKAVEFPVGYVDSMEAAGIVVRKVGVAIAGSELETGLLGHDFFGDYEITIKRDAIEFRPPSHHQQLNSSETELTAPTLPKQHHFQEYP